MCWLHAWSCPTQLTWWPMGRFGTELTVWWPMGRFGTELKAVPCLGKCWHWLSCAYSVLLYHVKERNHFKVCKVLQVLMNLESKQEELHCIKLSPWSEDEPRPFFFHFGHGQACVWFRHVHAICALCTDNLQRKIGLHIYKHHLWTRQKTQAASKNDLLCCLNGLSCLVFHIQIGRWSAGRKAPKNNLSMSEEFLLSENHLLC